MILDPDDPERFTELNAGLFFACWSGHWLADQQYRRICLVCGHVEPYPPEHYIGASLFYKGASLGRIISCTSQAASDGTSSFIFTTDTGHVAGDIRTHPSYTFTS